MRTMQKPCSPRSSWRPRPEGAPSAAGLLPGAPGGLEPGCPSVPPGCSHGEGAPVHLLVVAMVLGLMTEGKLFPGAWES